MAEFPARSLVARTLFLHCLRFDVWESGPDRSSSRHFTSTLAASSFLGLVALQVAGREPAIAFGVLLALAGFLAFFGIVGDVGVTLLAPRDLPFLDTLPVSPRQYFAARLRALGFGLLLRSLTYSLLPGAALAVVWGRITAPLVLLPAVFGLCVLLAAVAVLVLFVLQRVVSEERLRSALLWLQILVFVAASAGWLLAFQGSRANPFLSLDLLADPRLPTSWFAAWAVLGTQGGLDTAGLWAASTGVAVLLLVAVAVARLSRDYGEVLRRSERSSLESSARGASRRRSFFERCFVRSDERAGFSLARALVRRERVFRLQTYPLLAYPVLFLAFGRGREDGGLFALLFSHLCTVYLPLVALFLRFSDHPKAAWVFPVHAQVRWASLWSGVHKALVRTVVLPVALVVTVLLCLDRGLRFGMTHGTIAAAVAVLVVLRAPAPRRRWPFAESFSGALPRAEEIATVYPLLAAIVVAAGTQFALERQSPLASAALAVLLALFAGFQLGRDAPSSAAADTEPQAASATAKAGTVEAGEGPSEPFERRLRRELRALALVHAALTLFGAFLGWSLG